ncbi:hypothetical protein ACEOWI_003953 [Bacillus cereus]
MYLFTIIMFFLSVLGLAIFLNVIRKLNKKVSSVPLAYIKSMDKEFPILNNHLNILNLSNSKTLLMVGHTSCELCQKKLKELLEIKLNIPSVLLLVTDNENRYYQYKVKYGHLIEIRMLSNDILLNKEIQAFPSFFIVEKRRVRQHLKTLTSIKQFKELLKGGEYNVQ